MPELPEVESARRRMFSALRGQQIAEARAAQDDIVAPEGDEIAEALTGAKVVALGRRGKFFWFELDRKPWVAAHFGMAGWYRVLDPGEDDPPYWKLAISTGNAKVVLTDKRRLGRIWLIGDPTEDPRIAKLGRDVLEDPMSPVELTAVIQKRRAPLKAILLDQAILPGIGNYMADEILYRSRLNPKRTGDTLSLAEAKKLHEAIRTVTDEAVFAAGKDEDPPEDWLFHVRWGRSNVARTLDGREVVRETVGGRTTAWVPEIQK